MSWFDWALGPLDLIHAARHTIARQLPTRARSRRARAETGAVLIRVPHPDARLRKESADPQRIPHIIEVEDHLTRNGVRIWAGRFDGAWLHLVARQSQRSQVEYLLSGQLDVTDRNCMRGWSRRWADAPPAPARRPSRPVRRPHRRPRHSRR
jgi:hypothetical protein